MLIIAEFLASAILGVYFKWINEDSNIIFEAITKDIGDLSIYGMIGCLVEKPNYNFKAGE